MLKSRRVWLSVLVPAVVCLPAALSSAAIRTLAIGYAGSTKLQDLVTSDTSQHFYREVFLGTGEHGLGLTNMEFANGIFSGRDHSCVGPILTGQRHGAQGSSFVEAEKQLFTVRAPGLPTGTQVPITMCYSFTCNLSGSALESQLLDTSTAFTDFNLTINNMSGTTFQASGSQALDVKTGVRQALGDFAGQTGDTAEIHGEFSFYGFVGKTISVDVDLHSATRAEARGSTGLYPLSSCTGGYAGLIGVHSIGAGAYLEWDGQAWTGTCGDSGPYVPDNPAEPMPEPATPMALGLAAAAILRRRAPHPPHTAR